MLDEWFRDTPIETYDCQGQPIFVKREDLCTRPPMPPLAKMRGIAPYLSKLRDRGIKRVGVLDTRVSKSGLGIAVLGRELGLAVHYYFPARRGEDYLTPTHQQAAECGAILEPMTAGRIGIVYARAQRQEFLGGGFMLPLGFPLYETVLATASIARAVAASGYPDSGTLIVAVGTGTILSGLMIGYAEMGRLPVKLCGITASMDPHKVLKKLHAHHARFLDQHPEIRPVLERLYERTILVKQGQDYYIPASVTVPFPAHPWYEGKAWAWLEENIADLTPPILVWNVGS